MNDNDLRITIYSSGTTVLDSFEYDRAQGLTFTTAYPVGFAECAFFLPGDPAYLGRITHGMTVAVYNGFTVAWAGRVTNKRIAYNQDSAGIYIDAVGHFGDLLLRRSIRKPWADTRVGTEVWIRQDQAADGEDLWTLDQNYGYVHINPRSGTFANGDYVALRYTAPTGQTIKKITYNYSLKEDVQAWEMQVYNVTSAAEIAASQVTSTGTGTHSLTLATPSQALELRMYSRGNQSANINKYVHAQWNALTVYTETSAINPTEIIYDVVGYATEFSTDLTKIASNTTTLVPFVADPMTYGDIIAEAASYGDSSGNAYAYGVRELDATGKPILFYEAYPALTDYDYIVYLTDAQLSAFEAEQNTDSIRNWIAVGYNDESGRNKWVTPDDDATLKDTTSVAAYGRRDEWVTLNTTSSTAAIQHGKRILAARKDLQWRASASIPVTGEITKKNGSPFPVSLIKAGERLKIGNYLNQLSGDGLTLPITETSVQDDGENVTNTLTIGTSDELGVSLARMEKGA